MTIAAQVFSLEVFVSSVGAGFAVGMTGWFFSWGIAKLWHMFKDIIS